MSCQRKVWASNTFQSWAVQCGSISWQHYVLEMGSSKSEQNDDEEDGWETEQEQSGSVGGL